MKLCLRVQQFFQTQLQFLKKEDLLKLINAKKIGVKLKLIFIRVGLKKIVYGDYFKIIYLF